MAQFRHVVFNRVSVSTQLLNICQFVVPRKKTSDGEGDKVGSTVMLRYVSLRSELQNSALNDSLV